MGFFGRRRQEQEQADEALPFLTIGQAAEVRGLVRQAFAELGVEVTMHDDRAVDDSGRTFGLWNVAAACHEEPRGRRVWPRVVGGHVRRILAEFDAPDPFAELTEQDVATRTYVRFFEEGSVPVLDSFPHREFLPGVVELLALDLPESVAMYNRDNAERLGGYAALRDHAVRNLKALPVEQVEQVAGPRGSSFHVLAGESVYTAGKALLLPRLAAALTGEGPGELGWLLSVPNRHQVVWHCVRDDGVLGAVEGMATFARLGYSDSPGSVSPHVYWSDGTTVDQLTHDDDEGGVAIVVSPRFQEVLEAIAARG
jgi:hypothetical protein